jgi:hypothetical protein
MVVLMVEPTLDVFSPYCFMSAGLGTPGGDPTLSTPAAITEEEDEITPDGSNTPSIPDAGTPAPAVDGPAGGRRNGTSSQGRPGSVQQGSAPGEPGPSAAWSPFAAIDSPFARVSDTDRGVPALTASVTGPLSPDGAGLPVTPRFIGGSQSGECGCDYVTCADVMLAVTVVVDPQLL